jgi:sialate O-acetylesterase
LRAGRNTILVRVLNIAAAGGIWGKAQDMFLETPGESALPTISLAGEWKYGAVDEMPAGGNQFTPSALFNGMVAPLIPFGVKGAIWYQGESNVDAPDQYRFLLPAMIKDWRTRFGVGEFPFLIVQLANFMSTHPQPVDTNWARLREAQALSVKSVRNTALAVTIDIGNPADIHPHDKLDVGYRLALAAEAIGYGARIEYSGPVLRGAKIEGKTIRLRFDHVGSGLEARGDTLKGFEIAGSDKNYVWADAAIDGKTIVVSSPQVGKPVAVRYAWDDNPVGNLYNKNGLPASPFRTDGP